MNTDQVNNSELFVQLLLAWLYDEGNDNKKLLLEQNCLPRLLKLILSENRTIRRDAVLVIGSMSKYCKSALSAHFCWSF